MIREILKLGDPALYETAQAVAEEDKLRLPLWIADLRDTLWDYRAAHGAGRAIAAPQIGVGKRLIYMELERPYVLVNPQLSFPDGETYTLLDDCMSFPGLLVRVERHRRAELTCLDESFRPLHLLLEGDRSELVQHEYDHLDGILATMRAVDSKSFYLRELRRFE